MSLLRILQLGVLGFGLAACRLPTGADGDPSIELTVDDVQADCSIPVTIRNTGSTTMIHGGLCGAFVLQKREGDDWEFAENDPVICPLIGVRHELPPGEEVTGSIWINEEILRDETNQYRVWLRFGLGDENGNQIPDHMRATAPFQIE